MAKLKVRLIGCGGIANTKHMPALKNNGNLCEMVAFCDLIKERAQKAASEYGTKEAKVYLDYRQLLDDASIDIVHVLTPNVAHSQITIDAFLAGKHVLCEKPMSHSSLDAQRMIDAWKKSGKKFTIGYQNRFRPEIQTLHHFCEQGLLGDIYYAKAHAVRRRAVPTWGVFQNKEQQGGGPLIDVGTHALDITLWMLNNYEPESVMGATYNQLGTNPEAVHGNLSGPWDPTKFEVEDSAMGFIRMKNGTTIALEASWALNVRESREAATTLCGTKAGAEILSGMSYQENQLIINQGINGMLFEQEISPKGKVLPLSLSAEDPGTLEARQWLQAIINDEQPLVKPEQAYVVTNILDAIYRSAETRREIIWEKGNHA